MNSCFFENSFLDQDDFPKINKTHDLFPTLDSMNSIKNYSSAITEYFKAAEKLSSDFGFGLVSEISHSIENGFDNSADLIRYAGIGDETIESAERFKRFLTMIKEGSQELEHNQNQVKLAIQELK